MKRALQFVYWKIILPNNTFLIARVEIIHRDCSTIIISHSGNRHICSNKRPHLFVRDHRSEESAVGHEHPVIQVYAVDMDTGPLHRGPHETDGFRRWRTVETDKVDDLAYDSVVPAAAPLHQDKDCGTATNCDIANTIAIMLRMIDLSSPLSLCDMHRAWRHNKNACIRVRKSVFNT